MVPSTCPGESPADVAISVPQDKELLINLTNNNTSDKV
jgi:hypothetical protein